MYSTKFSGFNAWCEGSFHIKILSVFLWNRRASISVFFPCQVQQRIAGEDHPAPPGV
jgi:hypothetical protein